MMKMTKSQGENGDSQVHFPASQQHTTTATPSLMTVARPQHLQFNYHQIAAAATTNPTRIHLNRKSPVTSSHNSSNKSKTKSLGGSLESSSSIQSGHPTPLFQRLVSEEVQELKAYARIIEQQNRRLAELERVHGDLEQRLEIQSDRRLELEQSLEEREREWAQQIHHLENDRDNWQNIVQLERAKNSRLMEQVARKDQDIHRMLQRKVSLLTN